MPQADAGASFNVAVREATEDDWKLLRAIRLRALLDTPGAFLSDYGLEAGHDELWWREWLLRDLWLLAFEDETAAEPIGVVAITRKPLAQGGEHFISSLWVDPEHRRRSIAKELIQTATDRVVAWGARAVSLWILGGNDRAHKLYMAVGFVDTDDCQVAPGHSNLLERRMSKSLQ
jgi:GNAT superfamily N-acetyltransferase